MSKQMTSLTTVGKRLMTYVDSTGRMGFKKAGELGGSIRHGEDFGLTLASGGVQQYL